MTGTVTCTSVAASSSTLGNSLTLNSLCDLSGAAAGQVKFPATQNPSADANTLDDYEEGSWTPNQGAGLTLVGAFSSSAVYTKIGRLVHVSGQVSGATSVAAATAQVITGNLPFTVGANSGVGGATNAALTASVNVMANTATTDLYACTAIAATAQIRFTAVYSI